jgi:hypothetical protein
MARYVRKPVESDDVEAARTDTNTGSITIGGEVAQAGDWIVQHADGHLTVLDDPTFNEKYVPAPDPAVGDPGSTPPVVG